MFSPPGYLLFLRQQTLMAQPFDSGKLETTADAVPVAEQVDHSPGATGGRFMVSQNGVLAYYSGGGNNFSTSGGAIPVWSRDGKELYFLGASRTIMAVSVGSGTKFEAGTPKPLFEARNITAYDVTKDGRFLMPVPVEEEATPPITVVLNWPAGLKK